MPAPAPTTAVSMFGTRITLHMGAWGMTIPREGLDGWIDFYQELADRAKGRYAEFYLPTVAALKEARTIADKRRAEHGGGA